MGHGSGRVADVVDGFVGVSWHAKQKRTAKRERNGDENEISPHATKQPLLILVGQ